MSRFPGYYAAGFVIVVVKGLSVRHCSHKRWGVIIHKRIRGPGPWVNLSLVQLQL